MAKSVRLIVAVLLLLSFVGCARRKAIDHYNRGVTFAKAGQYLEAIGEFKKAIELRPDFPEAHNSLGYAFNQLKRYEDAIEHFAKAAENEKYKERDLAYLNLGTAYSNAGQYAKAEEAIRRSIELNPTGRAYYALAVVLAVQEKDDSALDALAEALALDEELYDSMQSERAFEALRKKPRYLALLEKYRP